MRVEVNSTEVKKKYEYSVPQKVRKGNQKKALISKQAPLPKVSCHQSYVIRVTPLDGLDSSHYQVLPVTERHPGDT
jgi:hypothetical protein